MSTKLFSEIVFGPLHSRRLGSSLGVNLLPYDGKLCNFDCIYCECGLNEDFRTTTKLPTRENTRDALKDKLISLKEEGTKIDVITFAGNGEPTMHPEFEGIIDDTIALRNKYYSEATICVLTNGVNVAKQSVFEALQKVESPVLKMDSAFDETVRLINRPTSLTYTVAKQVELYHRFKGDFILQTMFIKGTFKEQPIDNTTEREVSAWLKLVEELKPRDVMIYTIDRETPTKGLEKVSVEVMRKIADRVEEFGVRTSVSG